jgi:hypothetical protein
MASERVVRQENTPQKRKRDNVVSVRLIRMSCYVIMPELLYKIGMKG